MKKVFVSLVIVLIALILWFSREIIIRRRVYVNSDFNIKNYYSKVDYDGDGIDDQSDILEGTKKYIETKPKYKSKYYNGGYPDDGYGVCTDVVAFAFRSAGYDLRKLVDDDIQAHLDEYDIEKKDNNIDFRRVKNLIVYFKRNAISLTTDIYKIDQWQGGDVVIFKKHIGIVSDRRNKDGVSYVIHHYSPYQLNYEEDILVGRNDIVGHYRVS